jgi:hypothetical protein
MSDQRSFSRRDVMKFALAPALLSLGMPAFGEPRASAAGIQLIDFAKRRIAPDEIKSAGYAGVVNYVSEPRPGSDFEAKPITREYADALRAAGLHIVSNFQYGKPGGTAPSDLTRGHDGGVADAQTALQLHGAAGGSGSAPIFFSVDDDIDENTWNSLAVNWFRGINSVLGVQRTGIYGNAKSCGCDQRRRDRALHHRGLPMGMADESMVKWAARARRGALPSSGRQPREPRPASRRHQRGCGRCPCGRLRAMGPCSMTGPERALTS